ncbi:MAG TPA: TonB-dependent receptor [Kofleriaceae bacterium]|nr:TonB-dependent receptor [Kofleriaceae bacterium]
MAATSLAHAQTAPAIDVGDLPPLPAADEEPSSQATVMAATAAEEDVVVGAAKREQSLGNVASAVTVVSGDRLRRFGYRTIGEAVAAVAGVYLVDNRLSYGIGIRGLGIPGDFNTRILVLVDGASANEAWGAYAGLGFDAIVGIDEIARIEVIRGPVSSVYGTNAFFGIINIVTRGASETPRAWGRAGVNSINGIVSSAGFAAGGVDRQLRGSVYFMNRIGEDVLALPDGGDTNIGGDDSRSYTAGLVGTYGGTFGQIRALRYDRESPFAPYDVFPGDKPYSQVDRLLLIEGGHTRELSKRFTLAGRVYANIYEFTDTSPPSDPVTQSALDTTGTAQTYGGELRGRYELVVPDKLGITAGAESNLNHTRSTAFFRANPDELVADDPIKFSLLGLYTELDAQPTPWLGFTGGVRVDRHSELDDKLSPRAALFLAKPERYGVKLLYAEGFRNPSAFEAYFEDGSDFVAHPEDLRAETIRSYEAVAWAKPLPGLATRLSGFYWDARDIIEAQEAPENANLLQFQNVTRYVSTGIEAEASYRNSQGWYVFGGLCVARVGTEDEMGTLVFGDVTNAPLVTAGAGVSTPALANLVHLSTEATLIGERPTRFDEDGNALPVSPPWLGLNLAAFAPKIAGFDVTAGVRNLIGKRDLMPAPPDYDRSVLETRTVPRVPGEGREIYVKVGYSY